MGVDISSRRSSPQRNAFVPRTRWLIFYIRMGIWSGLMQTQEASSQEVERLKKENTILRERIKKLAAEVERLKAKAINMWGDS